MVMMSGVTRMVGRGATAALLALGAGCSGSHGGDAEGAEPDAGFFDVPAPSWLDAGDPARRQSASTADEADTAQGDDAPATGDDPSAPDPADEDAGAGSDDGSGQPGGQQGIDAGTLDAGAADPLDAAIPIPTDAAVPPEPLVDPDFRLPTLDGPAPTLPAIDGECPEFFNGGEIAVAGHGSIALLAGEPNKGGALLFYWHGTGGNAGEALFALPQVVLEEIYFSGGIIAAFNGEQSSGEGGDCSGTGAHHIADFEAADQIAACAVKNHGIDPRRIYSTGCSAGGLQSGCMAHRRSSYLAAVTPNSGGILVSQPWQDDHTPAIFTMHGGSEDRVGVSFATTSRALDRAADDHGGFVINCDHGGGHCGAPPELQIAAWEFMKDHPWGVTESPWADGFPDGVPDYCAPF
jgi:predicted esterase